MNDNDFEFLASFLRERSGLALQRQKEYLLKGRLTPVAQSVGFETIEELVSGLREGRDCHLEEAVTEAMTTNETSFFRDKTPFEELREALLPDLIRARMKDRRLRIWCAAASTGQEPYTIAMILKDHFPETVGWDVEILGTDISPKVLKRAEEGVYSQFEVQRGLPIQLLVKHFEAAGADWRIKDEVRSGIRFQHLNLLNSFGHLGPFDIVFCRNVLIYFDADTKRTILERMRRTLARDGYLILGAAETVMGITECFARFQTCRSGVYVTAERQIELATQADRISVNA